MRPKALPPTITKTPEDRHYTELEEHPAYALIGASRVNGTANLFGTDFVHRSYIAITLLKADTRRSLSTDWRHGNIQQEVVQVALSEAQWATFISTLNVGQGVPCTLQSVGGRAVPQIEGRPDRREQFSEEVFATLRDAQRQLEDLKQALEDSKLGAKAKEELQGKVRQAAQEIGANVNYVAKCFGEHVEQTIEHAKIEVAAYATGVIQRTGLAALQAGFKPPVELGEAQHEEERRDGERD